MTETGINKKAAIDLNECVKAMNQEMASEGFLGLKWAAYAVHAIKLMAEKIEKLEASQKD